MNVVYSPRALVDIEAIAEFYATHASPAMAAAVEHRISAVISRIAEAPLSAPLVSQRSGVRVAIVIRYRFRIFYRVRNDALDILHIRHMSRRPSI